MQAEGQLPLAVLFLDCNSFFASVEQQERPELRGVPMIVVPLEAESTCAIAATQEAKKLGIKTGTIVADARSICPELIVVPARPKLYKAYHEAIRSAAQTILPESKVHSIDEMSYSLIGEERQPKNATKLAHKMKDEISGQVGKCITCSVGIAPNQFLAKIATEIEKPNGLVVLEAKDLPGRMLELKITDLAGINYRMARRLNAHFIFTVEQLYAASAQELKAAFGSVTGERWWYLLRGHPIEQEQNARKSLSHSHVLGPELRTDEGCYQVMVRLLSKAAARLRAENLLAGSMHVGVSGRKQSWDATASFNPQSETGWFVKELAQLWKNRNFIQPYQVGITFHNLCTMELVTPSLFDSSADAVTLSQAVDQVNKKFGKNSIYLGAAEQANEAVDEKIAFNKTWLFSEGKGDNDWEETMESILNKPKT